MANNNKPHKYWEDYRTKAQEIYKLNMRDMFNRLNATWDACMDVVLGNLDALPSGVDRAKIEHYIQVLLNGMDQIIDRGSDEFEPVRYNFLGELGLEAEPWVGSLGIDLKQTLPVIIHNTQQYLKSNDFNLIRQIIPQLRNDVAETFYTALLQGKMHPSYLEIELTKIGLPYSPVRHYSPGQRAAWIAYEECNRIYRSLNDHVRKEAGIDTAVNRLNPALQTHEPICIAATDAGLISVSEHEKRFGLPPRHFGCGCELEYIEEDYYDDSIRQEDLEQIDPATIADATSRDWSSKMRNDENYQQYLHWENDAMNQIFGNT